MLYRTDRLIVRRLAPDDLDRLVAVYGDAEAMRWVDDGGTLDRSRCAEWIELTHENYRTRGYGMSAVTLASSGEVVGFCGIVHPGGQPEPEIKYAFLRELWGRGIATEAVRGMLSYGRERHGLEDIIATAAPGNRASHRVLGKAGLVHVSTRQETDGSSTWVFAGARS